MNSQFAKKLRGIRLKFVQIISFNDRVTITRFLSDDCSLNLKRNGFLLFLLYFNSHRIDMNTLEFAHVIHSAIGQTSQNLTKESVGNSHLLQGFHSEWQHGNLILFFFPSRLIRGYMPHILWAYLPSFGLSMV
jgi:hypothetical protein